MLFHIIRGSVLVPNHNITRDFLNSCTISQTHLIVITLHVHGVVSASIKHDAMFSSVRGAASASNT